MNYEKKYLKYKNKYLQLKKQTGGGDKVATADTVATAATADKHDVDSKENIDKFTRAKEATTYDNL